MTTRKRRTSRPAVAEQRGPSTAARIFKYRSAVVLGVFAVAFITLSVGAYTQTSATWDEPIHLTAGYAAVARQDLRVDPSHPPFLRMWAALPTLFMPGVSMDSSSIDGVDPVSWLQEAYLFAHRFLYLENDADRLLYTARLMTVLLGVGLGLLLFLWAREWLGFVPAVIALASYTLEPNLVSHASLVTTDVGVTACIFGAIYFAWRMQRDGRWWNVAGLAMCCGLAVVSKFSGLLLAPIVAVLLTISVVQPSALTARRALLVLAIVAVTSFAGIWAAYGFRYFPSSSAMWVFRIHDTDLARNAPGVARAVGWVDSHRLLPNAFTQGAFYTHASVKQMPAFLAGEISERGWWYYFPAAFVLKTPLAMLVLLGAGGLAYVRRRRELGIRNELFVLVPVVVFLGAAMASGVNIGLRHILPIYPFLVLMAAAGAQELVRFRRPIGVGALALVGTVWAAEFARAYPHTLTFFNQLAGGPQNGYRYLADSNLGWGQSLKGLKAWMDRNGVSHVNLSYFGQADPAYYGIDGTYLPGGPTFAIDKTSRPRVPGYVAISSTILTGVYAPASWRLFYRPFQDLEPVAIIGNSIRVYWVERWPEATGSVAGTGDPEAHRSLADALLYGLQWPTRAVIHYGEYLRERPGDADALVNYGIALVAADRVHEGLAALRRAVDSDGAHGRARLTLAKALFGSRDLAGAATQAERATALVPDSPDAHHLLGRIRAAQGLLAAAVREFERVIEIQPQHEDAREYLRRIRSPRESAIDTSARATDGGK